METWIESKHFLDTTTHNVFHPWFIAMCVKEACMMEVPHTIISRAHIELLCWRSSTSMLAILWKGVLDDVVGRRIVHILVEITLMRGLLNQFYYVQLNIDHVSHFTICLSEGLSVVVNFTLLLLNVIFFVELTLI